MPIIVGLRRDIFFKNYALTKIQNGLYITAYKFIQPDHLEAEDVIIIFQLNQKFKEVNYTIDGDSTDFKTNVSEDKFSTSIKIQSLPADAVITVRFTSKKILVPIITGIGGQLNFRTN